jgi:hypothetical protein
MHARDGDGLARAGGDVGRGGGLEGSARDYSGIDGVVLVLLAKVEKGGVAD